MGLAAGAGAPIAGLIAAFGDITTLALVGAVGGVLMLMALRLGEQPSQLEHVAPPRRPVGDIVVITTACGRTWGLRRHH
jgi:hypothetical protein